MAYEDLQKRLNSALSSLAWEKDKYKHPLANWARRILFEYRDNITNVFWDACGGSDHETPCITFATESGNILIAELEQEVYDQMAYDDNPPMDCLHEKYRKPTQLPDGSPQGAEEK